MSQQFLSTPSKHAGTQQGLQRFGVDWWDVLPLIQEPHSAPDVYWTPKGIIMAHPTKPLIVLYPQPPNSSEKLIFPSDSGTMALSSFGSATVLSVSGSGELVFAYFPVTTGSNSGLCCIWENMVLKQFWATDQGEAIVNCWWLSGNPRQRVTDQSGRSRRMPLLGSELAVHSTMALILMEDFTLQLVCESTKGGRGDGHFNIITANVLRKTAHGIAKRPKGMNPYTGYICTRASLGLGYNDAAILIAMQTSLLPSPRVPLSETQFAGLGIPSATFVTQPSTDDWEYTGTESSIRICEVSISCTNERGWDIQTEPLSPIALNTTAQLTHLQFVPKYHYDDTSMAIDGASSSQGDRYLVVGTTELGSLTSPPRADISVYSLSKQSPPASTQKWNVHMESKREFVDYAVFTMAPAYPTYQKGQNLLIVSLLQVYGTESAGSDKICLLELPLLEDNGQYRTLKLEKHEGPSFIGISPQGTHLVLRNSHAQGQLGYDTYPDTLPNDDTPSEVSLRNAILQASTSSQDLDNIVLVLKKLDYEAKLDIVDSAWVLLDSESAGGGAPRWMMDYIKVVLLLDRSVDEGKSSHPNRTNVALNILSLPAAKSALSECHGKDHEASYQPDAVWPLSEICGWIVEFTENILSAASQFQNSNSNGSTAPSIDPALLVLLNQSLVDTWVDSLALVLRFVKHVDVPKGTSTDSKTLVTRSVEDTLSQSPVNISLLTEALKGLRVNESISAADWRNAYRRLALSERIANVAKELVSHVLKPEIVTLLALHVRMAGLNLISDDYTSVERDVITKKPIADGNWPPPLGIGAVCRRCGGKTTIDLSKTPTTSRWRLWELSFERCVCGGRWKPPSGPN